MTSYQELILNRLEAVATEKDLLVSRVMSFANVGRLIVSRDNDLSTVVTVDFDFQSDGVEVVIDHENPRKMLSGPRDQRHYHWTPGNPKDDAEVARLLARWAFLIRGRAS